jgi:drug/metabolite transporter (DMT)-like permease
MLRFTIATIILLGVLLRVEKRFPKIAWRDGLIIFLLALVGNFLYNICLLYGLKLTSAAVSGIIAGTVPIIIGVLALLFLREHLSWRKGAGIVLVVVGMGVMNSTSSFMSGGQGSNAWVGNLLVGGAALGEALWTVLAKAVSGRVKPFTIAFFASAFALLLFSPFGAYEAIHFDFASVSLVGWLALLYYGVVGTVGGYLLWYHGLTRVSASTAGVFSGVFPVSALLLSYMILHETFSWSHIAGLACVLVAIILSVYPRASNL